MRAVVLTGSAAAALMTAKAVVRDEPWSVMTRDADFKAERLRMIEWDHNLRYGSDRDVRTSVAACGSGWMSIFRTALASAG